jgi:preprotein translocase subunit SecA
MRMIESQYIMLPIIDRMWVDHLYIMDALKSGIGLRGYGQKDPRVEYEKEAYEIFEDLKTNIADEAIKAVFSVRVETQPPEPEPQPELVAAGSFEQLPTGEIVPQAAPQALTQTQAPSRMDPAAAERLLGPAPRALAEHVHTNRDEQPAAKAAAAGGEKVGRNELCPCGSGKKYKRCHGTGA